MRHNDANGQDDRDGEAHDRWWSCGAQGPTDHPAVNEPRSRQQRDLLATLFLSQGVAMLPGGDEIGRTQQGDDDGDRHDEELSPLDWEAVDEELVFVLPPSAHMLEGAA